MDKISNIILNRNLESNHICNNNSNDRSVILVISSGSITSWFFLFYLISWFSNLIKPSLVILYNLTFVPVGLLSSCINPFDFNSSR